jgi:hypothetical protein
MVKVEIPKEEQERVEALPYNLPSKLRPLLDFYKFCVSNKNTSVVIVIDGKSGLGKSTLGGQVGLYCSKDFNINSFCFTPDEFLKKLETAKKGECLVFDEGMLLSSRNALSEINKMCIIAMSMIRSKQLFIIFCVNSIFDLDRNLALSRADILLSLYGQHLVDRGKFLAFFKAEDGVDRLKQLYLMGKKYYSYAKPKSNFNTTFGRHFVVDMNQYEKLKQEGVNKFLSGSRDKLGQKDKASRDKLIKWIRDNTDLSLEKIGDIAGLTKMAIHSIIERQNE